MNKGNGWPPVPWRGKRIRNPFVPAVPSVFIHEDTIALVKNRKNISKDVSLIHSR